jgi:Protein of unknown function (DUF2726)
MSVLAIPRHQPTVLPCFFNGEVCNTFELTMLELLANLLGEKYLCCPQLPLEVICQRPDRNWLPDEHWRMLVNSRVDLAIIDRSPGSDRRTKLVIECQSHYHDTDIQQHRDRRKAQLLEAADIPLIYVRYLDADSRYYRFYSVDGSKELLYNLVTQENREPLQKWLHDTIFRLIS